MVFWSFKNNVTEKSSLIKPPSHPPSPPPLPPPSPLSLLGTNISNLPFCHRPKTDKVFPDKPSAKVYSGFNIVFVYYTTSHTRLPLSNS